HGGELCLCDAARGRGQRAVGPGGGAPAPAARASRCVAGGAGAKHPARAATGCAAHGCGAGAGGAAADCVPGAVSAAVRLWQATGAGSLVAAAGARGPPGAGLHADDADAGHHGDVAELARVPVPAAGRINARRAAVAADGTVQPRRAVDGVHLVDTRWRAGDQPDWGRHGRILRQRLEPRYGRAVPGPLPPHRPATRSPYIPADHRALRRGSHLAEAVREALAGQRRDPAGPVRPQQARCPRQADCRRRRPGARAGAAVAGRWRLVRSGDGGAAAVLRRGGSAGARAARGIRRRGSAHRGCGRGRGRRRGAGGSDCRGRAGGRPGPGRRPRQPGGCRADPGRGARYCRWFRWPRQRRRRRRRRRGDWPHRRLHAPLPHSV
ncbi:hypothetical protein LPJ61_005169, partial [Coemansia biformis]